LDKHLDLGWVKKVTAIKTTQTKLKRRIKKLLSSMLLFLSLSQPIFAQEQLKAPNNDPQTTGSSIQHQIKQKEIEKLIQANGTHKPISSPVNYKVSIPMT